MVETENYLFKLETLTEDKLNLLTHHLLQAVYKSKDKFYCLESYIESLNNLVPHCSKVSKAIDLASDLLLKLEYKVIQAEGMSVLSIWKQLLKTHFKLVLLKVEDPVKYANDTIEYISKKFTVVAESTDDSSVDLDMLSSLIVSFTHSFYLNLSKTERSRVKDFSDINYIYTRLLQ